ncbi:MAG: pyridoxine 5'-phosphate synthase [Desulfobacterales bacterium]
MSGLAVNVDHVATLRQVRGGATGYPDPVHAAALAELGGADGIVVHLREDRRHIQDRDVYLLKKTVLSRLILEMAATEEMLSIAADVRPDLVTLVPEKRQELTTEGGLDVVSLSGQAGRAVKSLKESKIAVSLFVDPDPEQIRASADTGADMVEIHTGAFCEALDPAEKKQRFSDVAEAAGLARQLDLGVNAGHGLCYNTIKYFSQAPSIDEFSIGHSIVSRAALTGMEQAVREMRDLIRNL